MKQRRVIPSIPELIPLSVALNPLFSVSGGTERPYSLVTAAVIPGDRQVILTTPTFGPASTTLTISASGDRTNFRTFTHKRTHTHILTLRIVSPFDRL